MSRFATAALLGLLMSQPLHAASLVEIEAWHAVAEPVSDSAPAEVVNDYLITVSAERNGRLTTALPQVGEIVAKADELTQIECTPATLRLTEYQQRLRSLQSERRLAQQQLNRTKQLKRSGSTSQEQLNEREARFQSLSAQVSEQQARIAQAEFDLSRCAVTAPFNGVITRVMNQLGGYVVAGTPLLEILDPTKAELSAALSREQLATLQDAEAVFFQLGDTQYPVKIRQAVPLIQRSARTQEIRLTFTQQPATSGATGELVWQLTTRALPAHLLVSRSKQLGVMIANNDRAEFLPLPDAREGQRTIIDLPADTYVIVAGQHGLEDGAAITVKQPESR